MPPRPGDIVGAYELLAPLGSGGMGDVFRARDLRLGRMVAIKFVSQRLHGDADAEARLDREARLASALNHSGIVAVYDIGRHDGVPYVVMELIDGRPLAARIAEGRLPVREAIAIAMQVAEALAAAHDAGIVHRDLKPQNIMLTADGRAKVVDFGLSKESAALDDSTATRQDDTLTGRQTVLGTAGYMAPEQVLAQPTDGRADQFALGTIVYEMLTSVRAFRGETSVQTMTAILEGEPKPLVSFRPDVPATVVSIVGRCLEKRPERRYASTRDLAHDLHDAYEQLLLETRSGAHARTPRAARWPWAIAAAAVLGATAIAVPGWRGGLVERYLAPTAPGTRYIAVLPFTNVTRDPNDQVFADGLTETLASGLTQLERYQRELRVVPAVEVRSARVESVRDAREAFGITLAISGSIQRLPSHLRLTLNLVDANQLSQLGSRTIDITAGQDALTQDTVAGVVTALLDLQLEGDARQALSAGGTTASDAYELYVQGRGFLQRFDLGAANIDRAIDALGRAIAADPKYALAHTALAEAHWRKYEMTKEPALIERAVTLCEEALRIDNRLPQVHVTLALLARGRGRYEEAVAVAQRAIELDPVSSEAYRELGRAQEALGRFPDAEETYQKAVAARPDDWQAYNTLGGFYAARARWQDAESAYRKVIELTPDNTRGYNNLGVAYFRLGRDDDAAKMWERSMTIRPTFSAASNLGTYYFTHDRYADAARAFERAVELQPNDRRLWRNLGAARYWAPGERGRARDAYERTVQLGEADRKVNPRQPQLLAELADAYAMLGRRDEALAAATAVERLGPPDAETSYMLAIAYEQLGDRGRALTWLQHALANGYPMETVERSPSLSALRTDPGYHRLKGKTTH